MDRVQSDETDILSLEFARRLQHEYDSEVVSPERMLVEEQREAYAVSLKEDQNKRKRKAKAKAEPKVEAKAEPKVEAKVEAMPTKEELRALRIKALSSPTR